MLGQLSALFALTLVVSASMGCASKPESSADRSAMINQASTTIDRFKAIDPGINGRFFSTAKGYAVFPKVAKGGAGIGAAHGVGVLYEGGSPVGFAELSQASIGFQLGGQVYSEIIFFENDTTLSNFKRGNMEFAAQVSAVAAAADASANAGYDHGVAVFTLASKGLMYEASVGGQKFSYEPQ